MFGKGGAMDIGFGPDCRVCGGALEIGKLSSTLAQLLSVFLSGLLLRQCCDK
jgi:hypothetical protein